MAIMFGMIYVHRCKSSSSCGDCQVLDEDSDMTATTGGKWQWQQGRPGVHGDEAVQQLHLRGQAPPHIRQYLLMDPH